MKIVISKNFGNVQLEKNNVTQEMSESVNDFFQAFLGDYDKFDKKLVFNLILNYISVHKRILYSPISNIIYKCFDENEPEKAARMIDTMVLNLEKVIEYTESLEFIERIMETKEKEVESDLQDTKKAILKIWDHVNLAQQQYRVLKQTDDEYKTKFNKSIATFKDDLTKDMNSQLLTLVGMFTALAFLIFGGISSLAGIFSSELPLLKLMIIGSVWGICIINLIFVFLFCVGKMTKLSFASSDEEDKSIFQRYPIVWWSNYLIVSVLTISCWSYYVKKNGMVAWISRIGIDAPIPFTSIGSVVIFIFIAKGFLALLNATRYTECTKINYVSVCFKKILSFFNIGKKKY